MEYVYLVFIILALVMLFTKLKLAYPIVLVLGGWVISFIKTFSNINIDPEMVFFIFFRQCFMKEPGKHPGKNFGK